MAYLHVSVVCVRALAAMLETQRPSTRPATRPASQLVSPSASGDLPSRPLAPELERASKSLEERHEESDFESVLQPTSAPEEVVSGAG